MWHTNIYSNIIEYQKYKGTSIKVGCATCSLYASSGPKAEGVPTNNHRGQWSPCRLIGGLDNARHIVPTALLGRVQRFRNDLYKAVKGPSTRPIVLSMIIGSYWRRQRRFTLFEPNDNRRIMHKCWWLFFTWKEKSPSNFSSGHCCMTSCVRTASFKHHCEIRK